MELAFLITNTKITNTNLLIDFSFISRNYEYSLLLQKSPVVHMIQFSMEYVLETIPKLFFLIFALHLCTAAIIFYILLFRKLSLTACNDLLCV